MRALLFILTACAHAPPRVTPLPGSIPASYMLRHATLELLHVQGDGECDAFWMQPALGCRRGFEFNGCRWRCVADKDRQ